MTFKMCDYFSIPSMLALKRHICLSPGGEDEARTEDPIRCNETLEETK